ncbi:MAG: superinfection immunity protein [Pseudomonadota bacterium]
MDFFVICLLIFAYFLPSFVAVARGHQNNTAIAVLNIFLGWTFLGWVCALVWAFTEVHKTPSESAPQHPQRKRLADPSTLNETASTVLEPSEPTISPKRRVDDPPISPPPTGGKNPPPGLG